MKSISHLILSFGIITCILLVPSIGYTDPDSVGALTVTDDILRSRAAFAVVEEEIAHHLNLGILTEWDYQKMRGPVLLKIRTEIHSRLREQFGKIVHTVDFDTALNNGSPSRHPPMNRVGRPVLYKRASEIIRDFIAQEWISVIIGSNAPIGTGEISAIRRLQGRARYVYEFINGASVSVPIKNLSALIKQHFVTEIWPNAKGNLELHESVLQIGANNVHNPPHGGYNVTGEGVRVAVVDLGIDRHHSEFQGRAKLADDREISFKLNDLTNHGTHVAGIIGAAANGINDDGLEVTGVAPSVQLLDAQVSKLGLHRLDDLIFVSDWAYGDTMDAIEWAVKNKADVINMSLGWEPWEYGRSGDDLMSLMIDQLVDNGIVFVQAAGNSAEKFYRGQISSNSDPDAHLFLLEKPSKVQVTVVWDTETNDLDIAILDSFGKEIHFSRNKSNLSIPRRRVWYEQIKFEGKDKGLYTLQVEAPDVQGSQNYEAWVNGRKVRFLQQWHRDGTILVPGYSGKVITVGAVNSDDEVTDFSSRGPSDTGFIKPEVVAPGENILSTFPGGGYGRMVGTSMAAPHVAGVAALILDAVGKNDRGEWNFSPNEVKSAIVRGAERIVGIDPNSTYGAGLVKADNIIFSWTIRSKESQHFEIILRLTEDNYDGADLSADPSLKVAISWLDPKHNLDMVLSDASGKPLKILKEPGLNYVKISGTHSPRPGTKCYLDVYNRSQEPVTFTGASTHRIIKLPSNTSNTGLTQAINNPTQPLPIDISNPSPSDSAQDARLRATLRGHTNYVSSVAFSPDGKTLASGSYDKTIRLWNPHTAEHSVTLTGHTDRVTSIAFSPNGNMLASGNWDRTVRFWNPLTGKSIRNTHSVHTRNEAFTSVVAASSDGDSYWFASGSLDNLVWLWYGYGLTPHTKKHKLAGHTRGVSSVAFSADERTLASGSHDNTIKLWDPYNQKLLATLKGHTNFVSSVAFSPDGRMLASGSWDNTIRLWDIAATESIGILEGHTDRVLAVAFSPDGYTLASSSDDHTVRLWDVTTHQQRDILLEHTSGITAVAFSPDHKTLASAGGWDNTVRLWDLSPAVIPAPTVRISPSPVVSPPIGDSFDIKIDISGVQDVAGYQAKVRFDPTALRYIDSAKGTYLSDDTFTVPPVVSKNQVTLAATSLSEDSDGAGTLATFTFEVVAVKPSYISLSDVVIMKRDLTSIPVTVKGSNVVVQSGETLDVNGDTVVDLQDMIIVSAHFGAGGENQADVNEDGVVDIKDLLLVAGQLNAEAAAPSTYPSAISMLTAEDIQMWLSQAQQFDLNGARYQRGIALLQQLLMALTPEETGLLPNYPNPFNPETWIPYQLAVPADVSISIYAADGKLIRILDLGHQPIGIYQNKSRAAYWDGRNALGEPVASGVYFYTLTAGEFIATRKMFILK